MRDITDIEVAMNELETEPRRWSDGPRMLPIRRRTGSCIEVHDPGIPGAHNLWCRSREEARQRALAEARRRGLGYRLVHDSHPTLGWPHYHVIDPAGRRVAGHFFYGGRPPRRFFRGRPWREYEGRLGDGTDHFTIASVLGPEGHERLTREAAASVGLPTAQTNILIEGVRRVDLDLGDQISSAGQRRHSLRQTLCTPTSTALNEIREWLKELHRRMRLTGPINEALGWMGEALHLIQDSYSEAHTEREAAPPHRIRYIRVFTSGVSEPREHRFPSIPPFSDQRDLILEPDPTKPGAKRLRPSALLAINASAEYLAMAFRHRAAPANAALELQAFKDRHLALSSRPLDPRTIYSSCGGLPTPVPPVPQPPVPPPSPPVRPPQPTTTPPTIRRGSRGQAVVELQDRLNLIFIANPLTFRQVCQKPNACVMPLVRDGIFGPRTQAAVRAYQLQRRLSPDGVVGPQTWGVLLRETTRIL